MKTDKKHPKKETETKEQTFSKNQKLHLKIEDMTREGTGVSRVNGFTIFVPGTLPEEEADVILIKVKPNYAIAKLVRITFHSPDRQEANCRYYAQCGGCALQHMKYQKQLETKSHDVREILKRVGKLELDQDPEIIGMEKPWFYRNKAQFPVQMIDGKMACGFYAPRSHRLIPIDQCLIQSDRSNQLAQAVVLFCNEKKIAAYDENTHRGLLRHILIRVGDADNILVCLVATSFSIPHQDELVQLLISKGASSVAVNLNKQDGNIILGETTRVIGGKERIQASIGSLKFSLSAPSFFQVNPVQTEVLYRSALEFARLTGNETVWDAYCGAGTISLFLAQKAAHVYGVEIVEPAVKDAWENAVLNDIDNVTFYVGKAEEVIPEEYHRTGIRPDVIVVDPPRAGCEQVLLETIDEMSPDRFVYVSCDPGTLARDLHFLSEKGWHLQKIRCVDMFPQTGHVETVVLLSRT